VCVRVCVYDREGVRLVIRSTVLCQWMRYSRCNFPFPAISKEREADLQNCEVGAMIALRATG
jgi:hypothetical protein